MIAEKNELKMITQRNMAERLGVTARTLNNWDKDKILVARRTPTNRPFYTEGDYEKFEKTDATMITQQNMAERLGVTARTLSNWDRQKILIARRTPTNRPFYTEDDYVKFINDSKLRAEE